LTYLISSKEFIEMNAITFFTAAQDRDERPDTRARDERDMDSF
jgi:hypothetical protein